MKTDVLKEHKSIREKTGECLYLHFSLLQSETFIISFPASSSLFLSSTQRWTNTTAWTLFLICQAHQLHGGKHYGQDNRSSEISQGAQHDKKRELELCSQFLTRFIKQVKHSSPSPALQGITSFVSPGTSDKGWQRNTGHHCLGRRPAFWLMHVLWERPAAAHSGYICRAFGRHPQCNHEHGTPCCLPSSYVSQMQTAGTHQ